MSETTLLQVVRFPVPAKGELAAHITRLEEYEHVITGWDRPDIPLPTFEQWLHIMYRSEQLPDRQRDHSRGEVQFTAIEALVSKLEKCNLALVRKHTAEYPSNTATGCESLKLSLELLNQLNLEERYLKRLNELFNYFLIDCDQVGQVPQAQSGMRQVLDKILNQVVVAHTDQLINTERAFGVAEGATAIMIQTGACQPEEANQLLSTIKEKLRAPVTPIWNSLFGGRKKR